MAAALSPQLGIPKMEACVYLSCNMRSSVCTEPVSIRPPISTTDSRSPAPRPSRSARPQPRAETRKRDARQGREKLSSTWQTASLWHLAEPRDGGNDGFNTEALLFTLHFNIITETPLLRASIWPLMDFYIRMWTYRGLSEEKRLKEQQAVVCSDITGRWNKAVTWWCLQK